MARAEQVARLVLALDGQTLTSEAAHAAGLTQQTAQKYIDAIHKLGHCHTVKIRREGHRNFYIGFKMGQGRDECVTQPKLGPCPSPPAALYYARMIDYLDGGFSIREISDATGTTQRIVARALRAWRALGVVVVNAWEDGTTGDTARPIYAMWYLGDYRNAPKKPKAQRNDTRCHRYRGFFKWAALNHRMAGRCPPDCLL